MKCLLLAIPLIGCASMQVTPIEFIDKMAERKCEFKMVAMRTSDNEHGSEVEVQTVCASKPLVLKPSAFKQDGEQF